MANKQICPSCGSTKLRERTRRQVGEVGCKECGWYGDLDDATFASNTLKLQYILAVSFKPTAKKNDTTIEKLVGRISDGSGYSLLDGTRDLSWTFKQRPAAINAQNRLKDNLRMKSMLTVVDSEWMPLLDFDPQEVYNSLR